MITALIIYWSLQLNVSLSFSLAICDVESGHRDVIRNNDGGSSSFGACQIKYIAAKDVGFKGEEYKLGESRVNIYYSVKYMRKLLKRYHGNKFHAAAAYNAGRAIIKHGRYKNEGYVKKFKEKYKEWKRKIKDNL